MKSLESESDITLDQDAQDIVKTKAQSSQLQPKVPGYRFTGPLGSGTFGEVWGAVQDSTGQEVAVKIFHQSGLRSLEMERLRKVSEHPHIVTLLDANMKASPPYLVMSLMREALSSRVAYPPVKVLKWFRQMVQALHFVHERGLLHCDLKPSNVLTDGTENVRLADFGQSVALEQELGARGSLGFMAPEQAKAPDLPSVHWDVYGIGATTYTLLTGQVPRMESAQRQDLMEIADTKKRLAQYVALIENSTLVPICRLRTDVSSDFAKVVERCLVVKPEARTPSVEYLVEDLKRLSTKEPLLCRKPWSFTYLLQCFFRRHALAVVATALLLFGLLAAGVVRYRAEMQLRSQLATQQRERARSLAESGFGQHGLLWSAESLNGSPDNLTPRLQIRKFSPSLEQVVKFKAAPDMVAFSNDGSKFAAVSTSMVQSWDNAGREHQLIESQAADSASADKPYLRSLARAWWSDTDQLHAALTEKLVRGDEEWSTGGSQLLAARAGFYVIGQNSEVHVWGPEGKTRLQGANQLQFACFGLDSSWVVGQDRHILRLWDTETGKVRWSVPVQQSMTHMSVHPEGHQFAASERDNSIRIRSVKGGSLLKIIPTGRWAAYSTAYQPNGKKLFVCDASGRVRTWDTENYRETNLSVRHQWLVYGVEFDASGERFATFSVDGTARVWSAQNGAALTPFLEHQSPVRCVSFDKPGERLITGALNGVIRVFKLNNDERETSRADALAVTSARFIPKSQRSVVAFGAVALEGTLSGREPGRGSGQGQVRLYDSLGQDLLWEKSYKSPVTALALGPSGEIIMVGFQDGTLELLQTQNSQSLWAGEGAPARVTSLAINQTEDRLAVAFEDGSGQLFTLSQGHLTPLQSLTHQGQKRTTQTTHPTHLEFSPDGTILLTALGDEQAHLWDATDGGHRLKVAASAPIRRAVFSPNGQNFAIATDDGSGVVFSLNGESQTNFQHEIAIWDLAFSPDGERVATVSGDSTCKIWDLKTGLAALPPLEHGAPVVRARYSSDGRWLLTGAKDGVARLWNARTGELASEVLTSDSPVFALDFQQENQQLVVGSGDGRLRWSELDAQTEITATLLQREAGAKTGLQLTILPDGDSEVKALTPKQWEALQR